ncbi:MULTISPECIES: RNA polymerase sigma factor [unclassified Porphyromonas]|uniref:RNA polymerase sigma factor n=1 Tax=unclassified Porphyromonas TaxID=2645799 RepID=UPI00052D5218|nr:MULTISPECIES: sigma-70 family RNA polymerase sigma factor [unclassified Porphyromonas]KGN83494.1 RNA polymerase subunit sigma-24 [Porphyromonas sp. COT-290 OH860]KGN97845.1 RNA polymerase subunit sigma-24 [Porphyromonas sp. COT-290 OH3588]
MNRLETLSDDQLALLYADGCNEAFDALLTRYDAYIHTYIRFSTADEDLIEDIFQDTFIKVMTTIRRGKYTPEGKFKQWLTRITHNLVMDTFRRQKTEAKQTIYPQEESADSDMVFLTIASDSPNGEEQIIQRDTLDELHDKLALLPLEQQEVVRLRYWEEMSFKDIADRTGVSINTALGRMRYALINLRKHIQQ